MRGKIGEEKHGLRQSNPAFPLPDAPTSRDRFALLGARLALATRMRHLLRADTATPRRSVRPERRPLSRAGRRRTGGR